MMNDIEPGRIRGEPEAFEALYDALADRLHHYAVSLLGSSADADDVLQETFVRLARNQAALAAAQSVNAFAFTVVRNEAFRWLKRRRKNRKSLAAAARDLFEETDSPNAEAREAAEAVALALAGLKPDDREIVELKAYAGLTFREIAEIVGRPMGTVVSRYQAALDRMRRSLTQERR